MFYHTVFFLSSYSFGLTSPLHISPPHSRDALSNPSITLHFPPLGDAFLPGLRSHTQVFGRVLTLLLLSLAWTSNFLSKHPSQVKASQLRGILDNAAQKIRKADAGSKDSWCLSNVGESLASKSE